MRASQGALQFVPAIYAPPGDSLLDRSQFHLSEKRYPAIDRSATVGWSPTTNRRSCRCRSAIPRKSSSRLRWKASTWGSGEGMNVRWKR